MITETRWPVRAGEGQVRPVTRGAGLGGLLRARGGGGQRVTSIELFFDLVYVLAVTQLSHLLLEHLDVRGAAQTALLMAAVWGAWIYNAWSTNWFDPDRRAVRLVLVGVMLASLLMSAALPEAFGERGLLLPGRMWRCSSAAPCS
jgi:low temperature requirement protein LtrA